MKKILSLLICMCMVIGMLPVFTVSAADAPEWVASFGSLVSPGTLVGDYKFTGEDIPGELVYHNYTDSTNFSGEYTTDGFKISRASDFVSGKEATSSNEFTRINFVKKVEDTANKKIIYNYGLKGTYAIDLTVNADMTAADYKSAIRFDAYFLQTDSISECSKDYNGASEEKGGVNVQMRLMVTPDTNVQRFQVFDNTDTGVKTEQVVVEHGVDTILRFVVDTETGNLALYASTDGGTTFAYYGALDGVFKGDIIQSMIFNPRLGLIKDSDFIFKSVKIHEITAVEDTSNLIQKVEVDMASGGEGSDVVADPTNNIPDWAEVAGLTKEPGTKVGDYKFRDSNIPGEFVSHNLNDSGDFSGEYTEDGWVMTKLTDPGANDRAATISQGGNIQIVANIENDTANNTSTYQHGLVGTYVVDLYVNSNLTMSNYPGQSAARFDWTINSQPDINSAAKGSGSYDTVRVNSGPSTNAFTVHGGSAYSQGDRNLPRGEDAIVRLVIDTQAGEMAYFIYKNDEFVYSGSGAYSGSIIQSIYFTPRLGFDKGSTFTFQGIKIYEIDRYVNAEIGITDRNYQVTETLADESIMPKYLAANPDAVTENLTLPEGTWSTTNEDAVTAAGVIKKGYDDEEVSLINSFRTTVTPSIQVFKYYNLKVLKRADIVDEIISEQAYNQTITAGNEIVVPVKRQIASDTYSKTFVSNLSGVYDFELDVIPSVSNTYADGGKPVSLQAGFYDAKTGAFTPYATVDMYRDIARYNTNASSAKSVEITNGVENTVKLRVDTVNNQLWVYVNDIKSKVLSYTGNGYVNAFRVYADESAEATDSIILSDAKVVSLFAFDNAEFADADINTCADNATGLTIADVTGNPADAYGKMGALPAALSSYNIEWSSSSDYVDLVEKYAYRSSEDQDVVVTAKVYDSADSDIYVTKEFYINIAGTTDPEVLLESTLSKLAAMFITNQPADGLITDIVLPTSAGGNDVTWTSSNPDVLSAAGVINKNIDISEPAKVTLTATVTDGSATVEKNIEFTVAKRGGDVTLYTDTASIETPITGVVTYEADLNGTATLKDSNGKKITDLDASGTVKVVMDFNNSKVSVFENGVLVSDYIDFAEAAENFKTAESSNVTNEKVILDEYALYNYNIEKYGYLDELRKGVVTNNVDMISTTVGGAAVTWDSENTAILANDGTYNAPERISFFDVDFSITLPGGTGATYMETLSVVAIPEDNIFTGSTVTNQGVSVPAGTYQTDMMFDGNYTDTMFRGKFADETKSIIIDMKNEQDINNIYIANVGLVSCNIYVSDDKNEWTLVAQPTFDGSNENNLVIFDTENVRYVKIDNIVYEGEYVDLYEIAGFAAYSDSDKSYMDILEIDMPEEYTLTASSITLPATGSLYGSTFTWKSSHPDVISADGTVTKPKTNTEVLLTVTSVNGTESSTKTFRYYVKGTGGAQGGTSAGGSGGGGGGGIYIGDNSSSAFPETNTMVQTPIGPTGKLFADVETTDWFYVYVLDLKNENIVNGDDNNCFNPNNFVTREEFVKMIVNAASIELVENGEGFVDVKATDWFAPYVYAAKANGIVNGTSVDTFGVGAPISRQDMSVIINNIVDVDADISANLDTFTDDASISAYAYEAVYTMKSLGILNGYESGEFNPQGNLTRAEAAKVIAMVMDIIK